MSITREDIQKAERALERLKSSSTGTAESLLYSIMASELEEAKKKLAAEKPKIARQYTTDEINASKTMLEVFRAKEDPRVSPKEMAEKFPDYVKPVGSLFGSHMFALSIKNPFIKQLLEDADSINDFKNQLKKIVESSPVQRDNIDVSSDTSADMPPLEDASDETIATLLQALEAETAKREDAELAAAKFKSYQAEKDLRIAKLETKLAASEGEVARLHKVIKTLETTNVARASEIDQLTAALNRSNREKVTLAESKDTYFNKYEQTLARVQELEAELMKRTQKRTHIVQQPTVKPEPTPCSTQPRVVASASAKPCFTQATAQATAQANAQASISDKAVAEANGVDVVLQLLQRLKNARNM